MEKLDVLLKESSFPLLNEKSHDICHDIYSISSCHEQQKITFNDYCYLVETLGKWRVFYPKAQIKKYGAKNCWEAMQRTKTMCPRVPGAYFTITVRDIVAGDKKEQIVEVNETIEQNPAPQSPTSPVKLKKGIFTPPNIINWQEARAFLANLRDTDLENEEVLIFANQLKKKYNFG